MTSALPVATIVHDNSLDPTVAAGRPLINTELEPVIMGTTCGGQILAGNKWGVDTSPIRAAPRLLITTSEEAVAMT